MKQRQWIVTEATNGKEVLTALEGSEFDLVLMDLEMPELDGLETTRVIRERERSSGKRLPIIAMSAHALAGTREICLAAGMDDYLSKPFEIAELLRLIAKHASCKKNSVDSDTSPTG